MKKKIEQIIKQIADILIINGGFLNNPGLYIGEMGLVLFFSRYYRYTQNDLYMEYCLDLFENIQNKIHQDTPVNYKHGLAGIGSTIEYLVQNSFFEADTDEILEDFDRRIFYTYNIPYLPVDDIMDIAYYVNWRLSGKSALKNEIRKFIMPQIIKYFQQHSINPALIQFIQKSKPSIIEKKTHKLCEQLITDNIFWNIEPGIDNGLAGWGLFLLTELDGNDSWFTLFPNNLPD